MHQKPSVKNLVQAILLVELALFLADVLQIIHIRMQRHWEKHAYLLEHCTGLRWSPQSASVRPRPVEIRLNFTFHKLAEFAACPVAALQAR